ncbi:MAG TPA: DM13 domain-containing protein [Thermoleophilaceae bacterium]|nr:DM13 domain-containing protein [Thermoleophilaceae bacterium]
MSALGEPRSRTRLGLVATVVAAGAVVVVVVAGIWVSGGVITNDFGLAMALTAVWMAVAALGCLLIAWRSRDLRYPVIGAYLVTAAVAGAYLGRSMFFDDEVNEKVVTASPVPATGAGGAAERPRNVLLARGDFESVAHEASGVASAIRRAGGGNVLTLTDFEVDNGPDLRVYLVAGPAGDESEVDDFEDVGALKGNKGNQQYDVPRGLDLGRYATVVIWCRAFSVSFARAPLR